MTVDELKTALAQLPAGTGALDVLFVLPDRLDQILNSRGRLSVTQVKVGSADFGLAVQLTSS